jgi:dihydropteroate synthase
MGILNVTPDSFSGDGVLDGGDPVGKALAQAEDFLKAGADIIDIGGESTRPGAAPVDAGLEIERTRPVVAAIAAACPEALISIDTSKAAVAAAALDAGAHIINDVWGLQKDPDIAALATARGCPVVLMHNASRADAVGDAAAGGKYYRAGNAAQSVDAIVAALSALARAAMDAGVARDRVVLDPGIGFGKSITQNLALLNHLDRIKALGFPVLVGPSRKSFIGAVLDVPVEARDSGTAAAIAVAITRGADIVRVHDVAAMAEIAKMVDAILAAPADGKPESEKGAA